MNITNYKIAAHEEWSMFRSNEKKCEYTKEELFIAARKGDAELIERIIKSGIAVDSITSMTSDEFQNHNDCGAFQTATIGKYGDTNLTPLHLVCFYGHLAAFKKLQSLGANIKAKTSGGFEIIHFAAAGAKGPSALFCYVNNLVSGNCRCNYCKPKNNTPKQESPFNQEQLMQELKRQLAGYDINLDNMTGSSQSVPAAHKNYNYNSVKDLVAAIQAKKSEENIAKFLNEKTHLEDKEESALYYAINGGLDNIVVRILSDTKIVRDKHFYVAGVSVQDLGQDKSKKMYDTLKKYSDEDKNTGPIKSVSPGLHGQNVPDTEVNRLIEAVKDNKLSEVQQLIKAGAHRRDIKGSALYYALALGHEGIITRLLDAGVEVKDKHIYASGLSVQHVGEQKAKNIYAILKDYRRPIQDINAEESHIILGVAKKAGEEQTKHAFRVLAKLYHPDQNKRVSPEIANKQFGKVKDAYDKMMTNFQVQSRSSQPASP